MSWRPSSVATSNSAPAAPIGWKFHPDLGALLPWLHFVRSEAEKDHKFKSSKQF